VALRAEGDRLLLTVRDTGVGIAAEELPRLFERFHRVAGSAARTREGTGLGLALVHELSALHGGTVSVESAPGAGSTFTVALPFGTADVAGETGSVRPSEAARGEAASWEDDTSRPGEEHAAPGTSTPGRVLVVDDNADMRSYLARLLGPHWTVQTTANGEEALQAVGERAPDLVLTDVMMPRVDGFQLLRALRADPATADIPVIMLTARAGQEASVEGLEAGADDYLAKPFRSDELLARVRAVLERAAGRRSAARVPEATPATAPLTVPAVWSAPVPRSAAAPRPRGGADRVPARAEASWRFPSSPSSIPLVRRRLRELLERAGVGDDQTYDLLLAACEAATNAFEHAQDPAESFFDVGVRVDEREVRITVRDYGQWRERPPSMDRGRGGTLMSAVAEITAIPSPEGTTVLIVSPLAAVASSAG
jgi:CheY-like chemotaxis protein/anti-sigma regulatory factor (Ser/Thr protein kinase)